MGCRVQGLLRVGDLSDGGPKPREGLGRAGNGGPIGAVVKMEWSVLTWDFSSQSRLEITFPRELAGQTG